MSLSMAKTWKDADISLDPIKDQTIAVIGYGIQGDAQANNMKDSGLKVIVGLREGSPTWNKAKEDGHQVMSVADATKQADIVHIYFQIWFKPKCTKKKLVQTFQKEMHYHFHMQQQFTGNGLTHQKMLI